MKTKQIYIVYNSKAGEKGNLTIEVQKFENLQDAIDSTKGYPHLQVIPDWIVVSSQKGKSINEELLEAAKDFCHKVETGRAKSVNSYNKFKSIIQKIEQK